MIVFGFAELETSLTHKFFELTTQQVTNFTIIGAFIGTFYSISGFLIFTKEKIGNYLLLAVLFGRIAMVLTGLYPLGFGLQTFTIVMGTTIVVFFAIYIWLNLKYFK